MDVRVQGFRGVRVFRDSGSCVRGFERKPHFETWQRLNGKELEGAARVLGYRI